MAKSKKKVELRFLENRSVSNLIEVMADELAAVLSRAGVQKASSSLLRANPSHSGSCRSD